MEIRAVLELEDAETMAAVMESVEATLPVFNENKGMHASVEKINDTSLYDILIIYFEEADMSKVADMNILEADSGKKITQVSLKQSIENIEEDGFVCRIESWLYRNTLQAHLISVLVYCINWTEDLRD